MAITSGFFDSVSGDRTYDADQMSNYFDGLVSNGVYETIGERFLVTPANDGMNINVGTGRAIIQSHWVKNDSTAVLTLDPSDILLNRIDAVVLRLDTLQREISLTIKKGTAVLGTPTMPPITQTDTIYELYLASVYIAKGVTNSVVVTDLRPSSYCGWVTGIVKQVDTSDLFLQWQTAYEKQFEAFDRYVAQKQIEFERWFGNLTHNLTVDTTIHKYQTVLQVEAFAPNKISEVVFGDSLDEGVTYNANSDVLFVFLDGVHFAQDWDYTIEGTGDEAKIVLDNPISGNHDFAFIILKSVIGEGSSGHPHVILTQAEYDAMSIHDPNTIYIIKEDANGTE